MTSPIKLQLPLAHEELAHLSAGDEVLLSGNIYTMRDAGHKRCMEYLEEHGKLPFNLAGQTLFYAGPTPPAAGRPIGAVGPTTASRMDFATPALMRAGIVATIGKGKRSEEVVRACKETGAVYFAAIGGIAALLAECVHASELIAWEDLGTEALRKLEVVNFPVYVEIDTKGNDLYRNIESES
ncbi:FumA C-terminus/TtdB family hydratase beta subunit [Adlercreutzia sp. ZJ304]|uniref:FumA C-terminus/TtdB family hydratase beta subunit n=1 Tax=Adlercreutzia sp. ZJ304 TaxID=2709791 RepID=UPI0013EC9C24|nr:FumA C-terminus/TtdB family hydratase beta subunit [Adlercreutzia sp. ZJ304]